MARLIQSNDPTHVFTGRGEIEDYFHAKAMKNTKGLIGTELEVFVFNENGKPISPEESSDLIKDFAHYCGNADLITEKGQAVGLNIPDIGNVVLEPGGQVEVSTIPCMDLNHLRAVNDFLLKMQAEVTKQKGFVISGQGHRPEFIDAPDSVRSRYSAYYNYFRTSLGADAEPLISTIKSVCGLQVNLDPMGKDFHEVYRGLLLLELGNHFRDRTERHKLLFETYEKFLPEQMSPLFNAVSAPDNATLVGFIVDRFLTLKVPFLPDNQTSEGFKSTIDLFGKPPTIGELLSKGLLTRQVLDNCLSLQLTMPNLRGAGVVETRAPDSVASLGDLLKKADLYQTVAYDEEARKSLIDEFSGVDPSLLREAYQQRFTLCPHDLFSKDIGGGKTVRCLVDYVTRLSNPKVEREPARDLSGGRVPAFAFA